MVSIFPHILSHGLIYACRTQQYFRVAARLGDPDAQQELAFCLLNGKGCKKDKRESAKWYRAAVRSRLFLLFSSKWLWLTLWAGRASCERYRASLDIQRQVPIVRAHGTLDNW